MLAINILMSLKQCFDEIQIITFIMVQAISEKLSHNFVDTRIGTEGKVITLSFERKKGYDPPILVF